MKKSLSIKFITLLLVCLTFLLTGALAINSTISVRADDGYNVVFMLDENTEYKTDYVESGRYVSVPETPEMAGKIFLHWEDESGNKFSFKTKIEKDIVLTAKWQLEIAMYTVKFCVDGQVVNEQVVQEGQSVVAPVDFDCGVGKEFDYWDKNFDVISEDLVVNAILKDKQYTVSLYGYGKELIDTQQVKHGENFIFNNIPEVVGYIYDSYTGNAENIVEDGKIYLNYNPIKYTATFYSDGMPFDKLESTEVSYGETVPFPGVVSRLGYVFVGWFTDLNSQESYDFSTPMYDNLELHAKVVPVIEKYEVKFFDFDGNQYGGTQVVEQDKSAILPGNPYKEGYEFVGWNGDYNNITADTNVYPIFKIKSYTVKFYDGERLLGEPQQINHGDSAIEPAEIPTKIGYDFIKWDKNFNKVTQDLEIFAVYEEKTFVVMFYNDNMKKIGATQYVKYGQSAIAPNLAQRVGYEFIGWDGDYTNITEDVIFIAQYQPKVYTLDFYYNGQLVNSQKVEYGKNIEFYIYELEGYLFYGWYLDAEFTTPFQFNMQLESDLSVYAKMQEKPAETFTITFKGEDGSVISTQTIEKGQSASMPAGPQKEGYTFKAWEKQSGQSDYNNIQDNLVYVATYDINIYQATFVYGSNQIKQDVAYGESAVAPNAQLEGHTFIGWDKDFSQIKGDVIVNAIFEANEYRVIFKDKDSNDVYSTQIVKYGKKVSIPSSPQKEGYLFKKWQIVDGDKLIDFSFDTIITGDITIVAQFEGKPYYIYYYVNGELYFTQKVLFNEKVPEIDVPSYDEDSVFSGWSEIPSVMPAKNIIVSATITRYYKIEFVIDGNVYHTDKVLEGQIIELPQIPEYNTLKYNFAWENVPNVMPSNDLVVNGKYEVISADKYNEFVLLVENVDGKTYINVYVRGNVNIGGILADITIKNLKDVSANLDSNYADYNVNGETIKFVWAQGENLKDFTEIAGFVIEGQIDVDSISVTISAYAFDGDIVEGVDSSWIIIKK